MKKRILSSSLALLILIGLFSGCAPQTMEIFCESQIEIVHNDDDTIIDLALEIVPLAAAPAIFTIPKPEASGKNVKKNDKAEVDYSNAADGYIMIKYVPKGTKNLKVVIEGPSKAKYQYNLKSDNTYEVFPLSDGNGKYDVTVAEVVDASAGKAAVLIKTDFDVKLKDEFAPFIRANQYVNYNKDSEVTKKAAELMKDKKDVNAKVTAVYDYVVKNFTYDKEKAKNAKPGYLPKVDDVLKQKKGICFDYAAVMTAMLRSQGIPAKLVIGYAGNDYHAWINVYSEEKGWINAEIYFDGKKWERMDPTFASSSNQSKDAMKFIGDGKNYKVSYLY